MDFLFPYQTNRAVKDIQSRGIGQPFGGKGEVIQFGKASTNGFDRDGSVQLKNPVAILKVFSGQWKWPIPRNIRMKVLVAFHLFTRTEEFHSLRNSCGNYDRFWMRVPRDDPTGSFSFLRTSCMYPINPRTVDLLTIQETLIMGLQ